MVRLLPMRCSSLVTSLLVALLVVSGFALSPLPAAAQTQTAQLVIAPSPAVQNSILGLQFSGFQSRETIAVWITLPNGRVITINEVVLAMNPGRYEVRANRNGNAYSEVLLDGSFPTGRYIFSARGNLSGLRVDTGLTLVAPASPAPSPGVVVTAEKVATSTGTRVAFRGSGYLSGETVSLWVTRPNGSVVDLGSVLATGGTFNARYVPGASAAQGGYTLSARGLTSGRFGIVSFTLP